MILNLELGVYSPFRKPNKKLFYIKTVFCLQAIVFKNLVKSISKKSSKVFSSKEILDSAAPYHSRALTASGFKDNISFISNSSKRDGVIGKYCGSNCHFL